MVTVTLVGLVIITSHKHSSSCPSTPQVVICFLYAIVFFLIVFLLGITRHLSGRVIMYRYSYPSPCSPPPRGREFNRRVFATCQRGFSLCSTNSMSTGFLPMWLEHVGGYLISTDVVIFNPQRGQTYTYWLITSPSICTKGCVHVVLGVGCS